MLAEGYCQTRQAHSVVRAAERVGHTFICFDTTKTEGAHPCFVCQSGTSGQSNGQACRLKRTNVIDMRDSLVASK
jgi:hypothetical protein